METQSTPSDRQLQRVLWACFAYCQGEPLPVEQRTVCYSWVVRRYLESFGAPFQRPKLGRLVRVWFGSVTSTREPPVGVASAATTALSIPCESLPSSGAVRELGPRPLKDTEPTRPT
jgi:hypothetical protein